MATAAVIALAPVAVLRVIGMSNGDVVSAVRLVEEHRDEFLGAWRELHG